MFTAGKASFHLVPPCTSVSRAYMNLGARARTCARRGERKIEPHVRRTSGERDESAVNVWCHFAVRGNSGVSNIGTRISASKHLFNSHPAPLPPHDLVSPNRVRAIPILLLPRLSSHSAVPRSTFRASVPLNRATTGEMQADRRRCIECILT